MAGGDGTRFWPLSRQYKPKQLLNISGNDIMINETINRLKGIIDINNILVVAGRKQSEIMRRSILNEFSGKNILFEPAGRNTAACIAYAAIAISSRCKDGIMCVLPSDHYISKGDSFRETLLKACEAAEKTGRLITIGIKPAAPSTGYGYIRHSSDKYNGFKDIYEVKCFVEKPDIARAQSFVESGEYLWNSGIFVWKVSTILDNMERYLPRLYKAIIKIRDSIGTENESLAVETAYSEIPSISIDYGILERSDDVLVIPADFGWSDIGNWDALGSVLPSDEYGNIVKAKYIGRDTSKSIIYGGDRLIATIGLQNIIIADTPDALLVCSKDKVEEVKKLVEEVKGKGLEEYL
jgi:mannose-1-phosphate guanylyltransferase